MSKDTITIDGQTYVRADIAPEPSPIKILVLQRSFIQGLTAGAARR